MIVFPNSFIKVFKLMGKPMVLADHEGQLLWVSRSLRQIIGQPAGVITEWSYPRHQVVNLYPDGKTRMPYTELAGWRALTEKQPVLGVEVGLVPPGTGEMLLMKSDAVPIFDDDSRLLGVVTILTDMATRQQEMLALRKARQELQEITLKYQMLTEAISYALHMRFNPVDRGIQSLTGRQRDVLCLVARGLGNRDIARMLNISPSTVRGHIAALESALDCDNRVALAHAAMRGGLLPLYEIFNKDRQIDGKDERNEVYRINRI